MMDEAEEVLRQDPVMARLIKKHDPYEEPDWTEYERLCISIINQQLSTASAMAVRERVFELLDNEITPQRVLQTEETALREAGLSQSKIEYLRNAARAFEESNYTREELSDYSNEEIADRLIEIKGVGEWTARMFLLFVMGRPDILPLGDLAIRRGIEQLYNNGNEMTREEMREVAEKWKPYRSVATKYIWAEYESQ